MSTESNAEPKPVKVSISDMVSVGKQLHEKLNQLGHTIYKELIQKIADEFIDITGPCRKLAELIDKSLG